MGRGGRQHQSDPLRIESNITVVVLRSSNGHGREVTRFACRFSGRDTRAEAVEVLGIIKADVSDTGAARIQARRACESRTPAFVAVDSRDSVYLVEVLDDASKREIETKILDARRAERRASFDRFRVATPSTGTTAKFDATEVALGFADKTHDDFGVAARRLLQEHYSPAERKQLAIAFRTVADTFFEDSEGVDNSRKRATFYKVATDLEAEATRVEQTGTIWVTA